MTTLWCNGTWCEPGNFPAGVLDRGRTLGLGLFETMLGVRGGVAFGERHLARLAAGCRRLGWEPPWSDAREILEVAGQLMVRAGLADATARLRLAISGGSGPLSDLRLGSDRIVSMTAAPVPEAATSVAVNLSPWRRNEQGATAGLKCASYAENLVALDHARREGFGETLFFNTAGNLCEAAAANVFLVTDGVVRTPSLGSGCLPGVTRGVVIELARRGGIPWAEGTLTESDLAAADEVFLTSAVRGPVAVSRLEQRSLPTGGVTGRLRELWQHEVLRSVLP